MSNIQNLDKIKISNVNKIVKIPGVEEYKDKGTKLFGIKYFLFTNKFKKIPLSIMITAKDQSFKNLYSIEVFDKRSRPAFAFALKPNETDETVIDIISKLSSTSYVKESKGFLNDYLNIIQEGRIPTELGLSGLAILFNVIVLGITLYSYIYPKIKEIINRRTERLMAGKAIQEENEKLFKGQQENEPAFEMYSKLQNFIKFVIKGKAPAMILCGPPGMSKTYIVRRTFHFQKLVPGKDYVLEKGSLLELPSVYDLLYFNRERILVLDDFDKPLRNPDVIDMLKAITDSYERRILSFPKEDVFVRGGEIVRKAPSKFDYKGKLLIITNMTKSQIDRALLSRAPAFEVHHDTKEVIESFEKLIKFIKPHVNIELKREVLDYILELYAKHPNLKIEFRMFVSAIDARVGNPEFWKEMTETIVGL